MKKAIGMTIGFAAAFVALQAAAQVTLYSQEGLRGAVFTANRTINDLTGLWVQRPRVVAGGSRRAMGGVRAPEFPGALRNAARPGNIRRWPRWEWTTASPRSAVCRESRHTPTRRRRRFPHRIPTILFMAEHAAQHATDDRARDVGAAAARDLLLLDPAPLLGRTDHGAHRDHIRLEQPLAMNRIVGIRCGNRRRRRVGVCRLSLQTADRGDAVVHSHRGQRRILPGAQRYATPLEILVLARLPLPALNHQRRRAVVEPIAGQIVDGAVGRKDRAAQSLLASTASPAQRPAARRMPRRIRWSCRLPSSCVLH